MRIRSGFSLGADTAKAASEAVDRLIAELGARPDFMVLYATEHHAKAPLIDALMQAAPGVTLIGGTSCGGVMTERGFHSGPSGAIGRPSIRTRPECSAFKPTMARPSLGSLGASLRIFFTLA